MKKAAKRHKVRKTISIKKDVLADGLQRARARNRNFSNHIETLIQRDLREAGMLALAK